LRSGKYAVYPRTKSLEQVQEEYGNQFNGDTADESLPDIGRGTNPRLVLSVTARRLGARSMFNAAVINLETGVQEAGDTVNYQSLDDGVDAMEQLALRLTGQEAKADELAAKLKDQAEWERLVAQARTATLVVSDAASFTQAIAAINNDTAGGQYTMTLNGSFNSNPVAFTGNAAKTITLKGDASVRTISNNRGGSLNIPEDITLVLDNNVTLNSNYNFTVYVNGGTLVMKSGSKAQRVYMGDGTFTMTGGTISGNTADSGVFVNGGMFTMSGGTISGNTSPIAGGGVFVNGGTFRMSGGTISGNTAFSGGGVYVSGGGAFIKSGGGTIDSTNSAKEGKVAYTFRGEKKRYTAAGPAVNLDSRVNGRRGGWE
jgi:hypothetical protein